MTAEEIFLAALERQAPAERSAFLEGACGRDTALRAQVEGLLRSHREAGSFLDAPLFDSPATVDSPVAEKVGTQIGRYKLLQQIGEGGMGIVYMAEQLEPVRRRVALKIIKPGMDSAQVIARFEAERQALAVMDHPNIAKVLDAGTTAEGVRGQESGVSGHLTPASRLLKLGLGRPYFVMELVRGIPVTQYCDENSLPIRERLELFATVCQAIQHAHTKGIIHRDIKPTNVLVTRQDGQPIVKVIDFGVAKAMGQQLTDKTLFTEFAQMIGTPLYMSPEQAELSSTDIDTRSDIYSLGVLLYELLTGTTPVSKEQLQQAAFDEIRRIIREEDPPKPSTRISTAEGAPSIAAHRHTEPAKLARLVRGELDWIVMKALEKDRSRRYETASSFAADVRRYLGDEPVLACPPSSLYRFHKFARRNKMALMMTTTVALAALVAVGSFGWMIRDQSARKAKLQASVELALHDANTARNRALTLTDRRSDWHALLAEALGALRSAEQLVGQNAEALDPALRKRLQSLRARLDADETDRRFVAGLDDVFVRVIVWDARRSRFKSEAAFLALKDSFQACYGLEFGVTPAAEVATFMQTRPQPIQSHLLAALDVCLARVPADDPEGKQWLAEVLLVVDGDAWRKQAREAFVSSDWTALEQLLKEVAVTKQPPALVLLWASYLPGDAWSAKHELVLQAQRRHPGEPRTARFGNALTCDILAWRFSEPESGNEQRAVDLASEAVSLVPWDGDFWNTLGVAHYRAGNWKESVAALEKASELSNGGDAVDWLFLAMAHWQLGQKDEARKWYALAVRSRETTRLLEAELPRFRAEAEKLLEIGR